MKRIYLDKKYGRMGNALYRWANLIAYARDHGAEVWDFSKSTKRYFRLFPKLNLKLLPILRSSALLPFGCGLIQYLVARALRVFVGIDKVETITNVGDRYDLYLENPLEKRNAVILEGFHYDAGNGLEKHGDYIRGLFAPPLKIVTCAKEYLRGFDGKCRIAVHIRRGDYKDWQGGKYYYELDYYAKTLKAAGDLIGKGAGCVFVLFSDDSSIDTSAFSDLEVVRSAFQYGEDYDWYLMSLCDYIIAPPSTYSGWASFYGKVPLYRINRGVMLTGIQQFSVNLRLSDGNVD